ncbi:hypothetical protein TNCT_221501 [Trichonephila clavata]|uniref:Uncharacterized protein n=1 Tax=Trichonephila clavata TaxID=2740835 RepID=A0A8X6HND5_TRICU|nr:hypothetical protein TNCT_221501 [Trichonephila clavata]
MVYSDSKMVKLGKVMSCECYAHSMYLIVCNVLYKKRVDFGEDSVEIESASREEVDISENKELIEDLDKDLEIESIIAPDICMIYV